jgi:hypothetical protein
MTELLGFRTSYVPKSGTKLNVSCWAMEARPPTLAGEGQMKAGLRGWAG